MRGCGIGTTAWKGHVCILFKELDTAGKYQDSLLKFLKLMNRVHRLLDSGCFSDFKIGCMNETIYNVHKVVLCAQSRYFMDLFDPVSESKKANIGAMVVKHDPDGTMCNTPPNKTPCQLLIFHAELHTAGIHYGIPNLRAISAKRFEMLASDCWSDDEFPKTMKYVYLSNYTQNLRDVLVRACTSSNHMDVLLKKPGFAKLLDDAGPFSRDLVKSLQKHRAAAERASGQRTLVATANAQLSDHGQ
ncbi:uncharacterized protein K452DRAFT_311087 [Aplosporella prunicola CBS 121167]|uniref:BTB domain-containing protein n=1 Tax=Aplosporella prunicola CBS 121167 TaxID=1176127 RepID=A0A6A6B539_9PEZI|nr:uncharacterized protein K452DRAFT_311087 [Aplosporella prunicola CBS 121167]KAF2139160.1 hypothetical protein K452DRAFT_311087 [Aplosporella prunicola CBS 121167]